MKTNPNDAADSNAVDHYGNPTLGYGLTKREYFAALAMQGLLAGRENILPYPENAGRRALEYADALIEALNKEKP